MDLVILFRFLANQRVHTDFSLREVFGYFSPLEHLSVDNLPYIIIGNILDDAVCVKAYMGVPPLRLWFVGLARGEQRHIATSKFTL